MSPSLLKGGMEKPAPGFKSLEKPRALESGVYGVAPPPPPRERGVPPTYTEVSVETNILSLAEKWLYLYPLISKGFTTQMAFLGLRRLAGNLPW